MKHLEKLICLILIFPVTVFAQDSTYIVPNVSNVPAVFQLQRNLLFIDITQNYWLNKPDDVTTKYISGGFNINLAYEIRMVKNIFSIAPGIALSNMTVKNNCLVQYNPVGDDDRGFTELAPYDPDQMEKSKISTDYLDFPVEFRFRIKPDMRGKNFWIDPGFRFGFLISDFWKFHYLYGNDWQKAKIYQTNNIDKTHYGISLRTGYYKFGLYAFYSLSDLFEKNKGTELTPFSIGICLTPL